MRDTKAANTEAYLYKNIFSALDSPHRRLAYIKRALNFCRAEKIENFIILKSTKADYKNRLKDPLSPLLRAYSVLICKLRNLE